MKLCKKTVIGDLTAGDVQRTTISCLGIPILERRRVLLASVPIPSISGGGGARCVPKYWVLKTLIIF